MAKLLAVECREFIKAVVEKAEQMHVPVSIAVVNAEGHLIALERMDEAGFITPETAWSKAYTVAAFRSMSPRFPDGLVIQQWFKERNPQMLMNASVFTGGRIAASGAARRCSRATRWSAPTGSAAEPPTRTKYSDNTHGRRWAGRTARKPTIRRRR